MSSSSEFGLKTTQEKNATLRIGEDLDENTWSSSTESESNGRLIIDEECRSNMSSRSSESGLSRQDRDATMENDFPHSEVNGEVSLYESQDTEGTVPQQTCVNGPKRKRQRIMCPFVGVHYCPFVHGMSIDSDDSLADQDVTETDSNNNGINGAETDKSMSPEAAVPQLTTPKDKTNTTLNVENVENLGDKIGEQELEALNSARILVEHLSDPNEEETTRHTSYTPQEVLSNGVTEDRSKSVVKTTPENIQPKRIGGGHTRTPEITLTLPSPFVPLEVKVLDKSAERISDTPETLVAAEVQPTSSIPCKDKLKESSERINDDENTASETLTDSESNSSVVFIREVPRKCNSAMPACNDKVNEVSAVIISDGESFALDEISVGERNASVEFIGDVRPTSVIPCESSETCDNESNRNRMIYSKKLQQERLNLWFADNANSSVHSIVPQLKNKKGIRPTASQSTEFRLTTPPTDTTFGSDDEDCYREEVLRNVKPNGKETTDTLEPENVASGSVNERIRELREKLINEERAKCAIDEREKEKAKLLRNEKVKLVTKRINEDRVKYEERLAALEHKDVPARRANEPGTSVIQQPCKKTTKPKRVHADVKRPVKLPTAVSSPNQKVPTKKSYPKFQL